MKVFIVDDSEVIRERLASMLSEITGVKIAGYAKDKDEALKLILKSEAQVLILDIRIPGGNGINVLNKIKKENPSLIVIMLTNYPYPQYRKKCMEGGADYFFDKSTEFDRIPEVLEQLMNSPEKRN